MPQVTVTTRYNRKAYGDPDDQALAFHRKYVRKQFDVTGKIDSEVFTEGDPDSLGPLNTDTEFAIQSKFDVTEQKAEELKRRDAIE